ncbi:MAG: hypothetical protein JWM42_1285, partial [Burkholderia sp.]|nr:hypothetical protein [Burkholderia sp.]
EEIEEDNLMQDFEQARPATPPAAPSTTGIHIAATVHVLAAIESSFPLRPAIEGPATV